MPSRSIISTLFFAVSLALLATAIYRARGIRSAPRQPDVTALVWLLLLLSASFAVQAPATRAVLNLIQINLGQLLGNGLTLVAACAATAMVLFTLYDPHEARRRLRIRQILLATSLGLMTVMFLANPARPEEFTDPAAPVGIIVYYFVYLAYLAYALVDLLVLIRRRAQGETDGWVRAGMRTVSLACGVGLLYTVARMVNLTISYTGVQVKVPGDKTYGILEFIVAAVLPACSVLLAIAGFTLRRWGPVVASPVVAIARTIRHRRAYRRLAPLWAEVHRVLPRTYLQDRDSRTRPSLRLYGRVVEICDAEMLSRPMLPPEQRNAAFNAARSEGYSVEESEAIADAVVLMAGLSSIDDNGTAPQLDVSPSELTSRHALQGIDLDREATRLERVAAAYLGIDLVRRLTNSVSAATGGPSR
ncbi:MAB_1171c family putative transporter [Pseudonocardia nematodicida]|uniref:MAB_1171c family putative transporter n=1 Tax=Pseudonocardia nematodicida TaxID=1206997 RepID=A0ABV1KG36_9PSEU